MRTELSYQGFVYGGGALKGAQLALDVSLDGRALDVDTMTVTVETDVELDAYQQDAPVALLRGGSQYALWYLKSVTRTADSLWRLTLMSSLGRLAQMAHKGGIYNGVAAGDIIDDICGEIPYAVGTAFAPTLLYGYLPYVSPSGENGAPTGSAKDNLLKVLFALNATVRADADGTLRVENLDTATQAIITADAVYRDGATVRTEPPVTSVTVLEHQYIAGAEVVTLFSGTAADGQIVVFREPVSGLSWHTDTESPVELPITESGANYAILSAGAGVLTGLRYIHTTREVTEPVTTTARVLAGFERQFALATDGPANPVAVSSGENTITLPELGEWRFDNPYTSARNSMRLANIVYAGGVYTTSTVTLNVYDSGRPQSVTLTLSRGAGQNPLQTRFVVRAESTTYAAQPIAVPNPVRVEDATLVGITNSADVVARLADYYAHRLWIECDAVTDQTHAGDMVSLYNPFTEQQALACVEKLSPVTVSQVLKARVSALIGYTPWQVTPFEDVRELLTGNGTFTVPSGVTSIKIVLIGGGTGGGAGYDGEPAHTPSVTTESGRYGGGSEFYTEKTAGLHWNQCYGGDGGAPGVPGDGGKILVVDLTVSAGDTFSYACGAGGVGSPRGTLEQGDVGGDTFFGDISSAAGASASYGYVDPVSGLAFGTRGGSGISGGRGSGMLDANTPYHAEPIVVDGVSYSAGADNETVVSADDGRWDQNHGYYEIEARGGFGGGPAYKGDGFHGGAGGGAVVDSAYTVGYARARPGVGGRGGIAQSPPVASGYGTGGTGGNGGGGGGAYGWPAIARNNYKEGLSGGTVSILLDDPAPGGLGSSGGTGAPGCILVYYRRPITS